jgi:hypothetical protein
MGYASYYSNYNTAGVVMRQSFAEYVAKFKNTKPINSKQSNYAVPLGSRKHWNMASISMPDDDTVCLNYYKHPLVVWKSDDTFTIHSPVYYSAYVPNNIQQFVPMGIGFSWDKGRLLVTSNMGEKSYILRAGETIKFRKTGDSFEMIDVPVEYAIRKIRGSEKKYLKLCEPFLEWVDLVQSIAPETNDQAVKEVESSKGILFKAVGLMDEDEYEAFTKTKAWSESPNRWDINHSRQHFPHGGSANWRGARHNGFDRNGCAKLYEWVTGPLSDNWVHALNVLKHHEAERKHYRVADKHWGVNFVLNREKAVKYLGDIALFLHFDDCFRKVPLAVGEVPTKQNAEFLTELGPVL